MGCGRCRVVWPVPGLANSWTPAAAVSFVCHNTRTRTHARHFTNPRIHAQDIFLESGDAKEMAFVRECLDMGADLRSFQGSVHSVAETLVRFLEALAEPVIPYKARTGAEWRGGAG